MASEATLDRTLVTPFLLRCYWRNGHHNGENDYKQAGHEIYPSNEILM